MTDSYGGTYADISAFVGDGNAINAATKTALNTGLLNISNLFNPAVGASAPHPDFSHVSPVVALKIQKEVAALIAAVTAHA